jgi:hypothetical protein
MLLQQLHIEADDDDELMFEDVEHEPHDVNE